MTDANDNKSTPRPEPIDGQPIAGMGGIIGIVPGLVIALVAIFVAVLMLTR